MATKKTEKKVAAKATQKAKVKYPEKFTATAISSYIAEKHELPKKQAKEILDSLYDVINAGVMSGERVPVGTIGKLHVRVRPATKARIGRNPATGEEIKISAKKATKVPKFSFNKNFKEEVLKAKMKKD
ncbi:MAG: HU family DNA-binding protein [Spirochaetae bacterium HGW-Spirochaetae-1]|jgi:nucleoid DNA-binding protein|nr:MAG: HU family DNA-binding protein [Spirochaetae bacterium HGW-Spirochaetae-1]